MFRAIRARPEVVDGFRMRGLEVSRLEGFSDAVFGFALTLLVVSLDVPKTFADLLSTMRGFPAFAVCFLLLTLIWDAHYRFCRRYGLQDGSTRVLTCVLLFLVLFYVYPLKFLFNLSMGDVAGNPTESAHMTLAQFSVLFRIYGLGFAAVYLSLLALYVHAWRLRDVLELNELERLDTRFHLYRLLSMVLVGLLGALLAWIPATVRWAGLIYLILVPIMRIHRIAHRRQRAPLRAQLEQG